MITEQHRSVFQQILDAGKSYLLSFHLSPDPDSIGSNLALAQFLRDQGKQVTVLWGATGVVPEYDYLVCGHEVLDTPISKLDASVYDVLVILDTASPSRSPIASDEERARWKNIIILDHHIGNNWEQVQGKLVDPNATSTCELLADLIIDHDASLITPSIADMLKIGMWSDTRGFTRRATAAVFTLYAQLLTINPSLELVQRFEQSLKITDIPVFQGMLETVHMVKHNGLKYALVFLPQLAGRIASTHLATDFFGRFSEVDVTCVVVAQPDEAISKELMRFRISVRSNTARAAGLARKIAEQLGGSGHDNASGARMDAQNKESVMERIQQSINNI